MCIHLFSIVQSSNYNFLFRKTAFLIDFCYSQFEVTNLKRHMLIHNVLIATLTSYLKYVFIKRVQTLLIVG